ncbi:MAG: ABC transporter permease [Armatimonadetes bacterium]|nr:ABC transporter permease [Armatimonadota bacterium]
MTLWREALRRLRRHHGAVAGACVLTVLVAASIFAPLLAPYNPIDMSVETLQPPTGRHLMGTDIYGRDILSQILYGGRVSLRVGLISVAIGATTGLILGLWAGYAGGWADTLEMRFIDIMLAFPGLLLALAIAGVLGPGITNTMVAVGIASIPEYARLVRGTVLSAKEFLYVEAARAVGCVDARVVRRHILPNIVAPVLILATLGIGRAILTGAALGFLGLGAQPPTPEWGAMLSTGRDHLRVAWWVSTFPGLAIAVAVLSINMLGDGLRDALDPRLRT